MRQDRTWHASDAPAEQRIPGAGAPLGGEARPEEAVTGEGLWGAGEVLRADATRVRYDGPGRNATAAGGGQAKGKGREVDAGAGLSGSTSAQLRRRPGSTGPLRGVDFKEEDDEALLAGNARLTPERGPQGLVMWPQELGKQGVAARNDNGRREGSAAVAGLQAPAMPSSTTTLAGIVLLAFFLLVLPAVLPSVPSPPVELLLLPVIIMGLLLFAAHSRDVLPPAPLVAS